MKRYLLFLFLLLAVIATILLYMVVHNVQTTQFDLMGGELILIPFVLKDLGRVAEGPLHLLVYT